MMTRLQYLLTKLAEEGGEISQMALKTQVFGLEEKKDGQGLTNRERLVGEIEDLMTIVKLLNVEFGLGFVETYPSIKDKVKKVNHWYDYSSSKGMVERREAHQRVND